MFIKTKEKKRRASAYIGKILFRRESVCFVDKTSNLCSWAWDSFEILLGINLYNETC